ncbi:MAG: protein kinase [Planctomycetes bacterium]|nr:protein kinase [Planctomycetota bacterium]
MNRANTIPPQPIDSRSVDEFVEAYESACELQGQTNFVDFLPSPDHEFYRSVAAEVIRVDMEFSWNSGQKKRLPEYQKIVPAVLDDRETLGQIAFEEYRLRMRAGEKVSSKEYRTRYGIDTNHWPREISPATETVDSSHAALMQEALVLADNVQNFPAEGDQFLVFTLRQEIGRGAFARVYLAQQGELANRLVVLKVASGHSLEPQHLARLQHTNIVPIYSVHRQDDLTAVCMPFFGTRTFADLLDAVHEKSGGLATEQNLISTFLNQRDPTQIVSPAGKTSDGFTPIVSESKTLAILTKSGYVDAVVWLIKHVAEGISHAHQRGIVHRDLKPANILLTDEGVPMVLDFNLSENVVVNGPASLLVGGTLPYMAPEHLEAVSSGGKIGVQTDLFSLGVIFYELLTGKRPFPDRQGNFDTVVQNMIADRQASCPSIRALNHAVPPSIAAVVERCLAPNIQDRYLSTDELTEDLDRHLSHRPLAHAANRSIAERGQKWLKRHPRISSGAGVAAIAGVLLIAVAGLWLVRGRHLARLEAESTFAAFSQEQPSLYMGLVVPHSETQVLQDSIQSTRKNLASYGVLEDADWRERPAYQALSVTRQKELNDQIGELLYLTTRANEQLLEVETDTQSSASLLEESLELNRLALEVTSSYALLKQKARLLDEKGSHDVADKIRLQADMLSYRGVIDHYAAVYDFLDARNYRQAKPLLTVLRDRNPTDPVPWLLLGDANAALGLLQESEGCLTTAIAFQQESYMGYYHRGRCRMDLKRYEAALSDFEQVIQLRPQLTCGYLNRALAYQAMGSYHKAIADLTKALGMGATQTRIYFLRAALYRQVGEKKAAEKDLKTGLAKIPSDELSWVARGYAQRKTNPEAAMSDFRQALQLNPFSIKALRNSVYLLADHLKQPQEALEAINQLLALNENDLDALVNRSVLYARQGNRQAALADVKRLLRNSKKPQVLFQAACALSLTSTPGNSDARKSLVLLARAVQLEPRWFARALTDPDLKNVRQQEAFQAFRTNFRNLNTLNLNLNKPSPSESAAAKK